jgi:cell division septal protein FtsQ
VRPGPRRPGWRPRRAPAPPIAGRRWAAHAGRRPRRFGSLDEGVRRRGRRAVAVGLAALELAALLALLLAPAFRVHHVDVTGNRRLTAAQVVAAAGLAGTGPVFLVDPAGVERRLEGTTWVRWARVSPVLPDRVSVRVDEWQPVAVYRAAGGAPWLLSTEAVALGPAGAAPDGALLDIEGPARPQPREGRPALVRTLLVALVNIQRDLPALIGQEVRSFTIDGCGNLTLNSKRGWTAQFGRMLTPEEYATLRDKVGALKAVAAGGEDLNSPNLQYVNVMNPIEPAVKQKDAPAPVRAGRSPAPPQRSPAPAPTPVPAACH